MSELTLHTAAWTATMRHVKTFDTPSECEFMPVRTSVGLPRFWPEANGFPVARLITPYRLTKLEGAEFENAYIDRLDEAGVDAVRAELAEIAVLYDKPLALLCFEKDRSECHRGMFADWWEYRTGEQVTELQLATATKGT